MTTAQLNAFRMLHEATTRTEQTMTAREMALTPAVENRTGTKATVKATGEVWTWDARREVWGR